MMEWLLKSTSGSVMIGVAIAFWACGGGRGGEGNGEVGGGERAEAASSPEDLRIPDVPRDTGETKAEEKGPPPDPPLPTDPLPVLENGTYTWTDGANKVTIAHNDGKVFLLESSFSCIGETGCIVHQEFFKFTCNKAFQKGYMADIIDGVFEIHGIRNTDTLYGAVETSHSLSLLYLLTPSAPCCNDWFKFSAAWHDEQDCSDYAIPDCDPYTDAYCQEGMNCIFGAEDKPVCIVAGETPVGEKCSTQADCADGICMQLDAVEGQFCYKYCKTAADCPWGSQCLGIVGHQWRVCSLSADQFETCNLLTQNCSKPTDGCYWSGSPINQPICMPSGEGVAGDECSAANDCMKGYDCIAQKECRKLCNLQEGFEPKCDDAFVGCSKHYPPQQAGYCGE